MATRWRCPPPSGWKEGRLGGGGGGIGGGREGGGGDGGAVLMQKLILQTQRANTRFKR